MAGLRLSLPCGLARHGADQDEQTGRAVLRSPCHRIEVAEGRAEAPDGVPGGEATGLGWSASIAPERRHDAQGKGGQATPRARSRKPESP